jgi:hypothetical protein
MMFVSDNICPRTCLKAERLQRFLRLLQRLEAGGEFGIGISKAVRNPLGDRIRMVIIRRIVNVSDNPIYYRAHPCPPSGENAIDVTTNAIPNTAHP